MPVPEYGSLENRENKAFRTDEATKMSGTFKSPSCLFNFIQQQEENENNIYAIKNVKNNGYLQNHIQKYAHECSGDGQRWRFMLVSEPNVYHIQNVANNAYLTKHCSELTPKAGKAEEYIVETRKHI